MYTVGSLFTGVGMFDLGFRAAGFRIRWQIEYDRWCQELLHARGNLFDHPAIYGDVRACGAGRQHEPERADVLIGGPPCQGFSIAGRKKGASDHRNLWPEYRRIISELRPRAVLVENVAAICNPTVADDGTRRPAYALTIVGELAALGYDARWTIIRASDTGAEHARKRWWLVAYADSTRLEGAHRGQPQQPRTTGCYRRQAQSRLARDADGVAYRLDEPRYPAGVGTWQHDYEPPRTAAKAPHQRQRTQALGNGLSPQIAYLLAVGVREHLEAIDREDTR
jgi:DNA (cytosine-5)-methyltransferase 1